MNTEHEDLATVAKKYTNLLDWNVYKEIKLDNKTCLALVKSQIYQIKFIWDGKFICDGIVGESTHKKSQEGAVKDAIRNYLTISGQEDLLTEEQLQSLV